MQNLLTDIQYCQTEINRMFVDLFTYWYKNPNKTFKECFVYVRNNYDHITFEFTDFNKDDEVFICDLNTCFSMLSASLLSQGFSYMYETARNGNYDTSFSNKTVNVKNLKNRSVQGNNVNYDQIMTVVRQSIAHNSKNQINYSFDMENLTTTFTSNKTNVIITLSNNDLSLFLRAYFLNIKKHKFEDFRETETTKDEHQIRYITELENLGEDILKQQKILFYYPFKQNSLNNMTRCVELKNAYSICQKNMDINFNDFINEFKSHTSTLADIKMDIINPLKINLLFQILSYIDIKDILSMPEMNNIPLRRIRNAVMHGTFFTSRDGIIYFYDCENKAKKEEDLSFIYSMSLETIDKIYEKICEVVFSSNNAYTT